MKVNFNQKVKDFKGVEGSESISDVVAQALFQAGMNGDESITSDEKYMAYKLSQKIVAGAENDLFVDISTEEGTLIKKTCEKMYVAGAYGQIYDLIEQSEK